MAFAQEAGIMISTEEDVRMLSERLGVRFLR